MELKWQLLWLAERCDSKCEEDSSAVIPYQKQHYETLKLACDSIERYMPLLKIHALCNSCISVTTAS